MPATHAIVAAHSPPRNEEGAASTAPSVNQEQNEHAQYAGPGAARKAWLGLQAQALLAGFVATLTEDDAGRTMLVVSRWALCRYFTDVTQASVWLARVGGAGARAGR